MKELLTKIAKIKKEIGTLSKNAENPFFKSKYLELNEILTHLEPLLEKYGLMILQPIVNGEVVTQIIEIETNSRIISAIKLPELNDPQKTGSCITYFRRYSLQSLLSLQAEDDDGNKAAGNKELSKSSTINLFSMGLSLCENANDLNAFINKHWISKMTDGQKQELNAHAKLIGATYDKSKKIFV